MTSNGWLSSMMNINADYRPRTRYEMLRSILNRNGNALQLLADLKTDLNNLYRHDFRIHRRFQRLIDETSLMAEELNLMANKKYIELYNILFRIASEVSSILHRTPEDKTFPLGVSLNDRSSENPDFVSQTGTADPDLWAVRSFS